MFVTRFIISNVFSAILVGIILLLKRVLQDKVSLKFQYQIWFVLLFSLAIVFLPTSVFQVFELGTSRQAVMTTNNATSEISVTAPDMVSDEWLYDFTEMTEIVNKIETNTILLFSWIIGMLFIFGYYYCGNRKLRMIMQHSEVSSEHIRDIFEHCCKNVSIKRKIHLLQSDMVTSPITFGYKTPYVVLPGNIIKGLSDTEIEHIILHELTHIKNKDIWINFISCLEQLIYWFNPVIWWAFSKMKRDREAYCDWIVLNSYKSNEERLCYFHARSYYTNNKR